MMAKSKDDFELSLLLQPGTAVAHNQDEIEIRFAGWLSLLSEATERLVSQVYYYRFNVFRRSKDKNR